MISFAAANRIYDFGFMSCILPLNPLKGTFPKSLIKSYSPFRGLGGKFVIRNSTFVICLVLIIFVPIHGFSWGFWAHKKINRAAVSTLPKPMLRFYQNNIEYLSAHSVDPDKKRYIDSTESARHYIDLDAYGKYPYQNIPRRYNDAKKKFGEKKLNKFGTLPWEINWQYYRLVEAFRDKDSESILRISAHLGHYIADATVPLHTTRNYNGQLTNQKGIHSLWESTIPEQFGDGYKLSAMPAFYIKGVQDFAWQIILNSNLNADNVLLKEKELNANFPEDKKYAKSDSSGQIYSGEYVRQYNAKLNGMVEHRFDAAIIDIGCLWMSAWVDAGRPVLKFKKTTRKQNTLPTKEKYKGKNG